MTHNSQKRKENGTNGVRYTLCKMTSNGTSEANDSNNASSSTHSVDEPPPPYNGTPETDSNGVVTKNTFPESESITDFEEDDVECGWGRIRPRMLQFFNRPPWFLAFLCLFAVTQGITVNGLVYVVTTTLERRFQLQSAKSGSISSAYDFSVMVVIIFVTYFGENRHKPKLLAMGAFTFALGSLIFSLPHYLTPFYDVSSGEFEFCSAERDEAMCQSTEASLSGYFWVFVLAQFLHGLGASPSTL